MRTIDRVTRGRKIAGVLAGLSLSAAFLYAHKDGPDPRRTGAPGDETCATSDCHTGTPINGGGGSVAVNFPDGQNYVPGQKKTFTIVITDPVAKVYGFQMTARLESDLVNGQAGDFTAASKQLVICDNTTIKKASGCPAKYPVQFIEHSIPWTTGTINVTWTPPATDAGEVHLYVAANAANNNDSETGDHIYLADYILPVVQPCTDSTPSISAAQSAGAFNAQAGLSSGTWLEIFGSNLTCSAAREWSGGDFNGSTAPTSLNKVSVTVDGVPAYVRYLSASQINVQAPDDPNTGAGIQIIVTNSAGPSNALTMTKTATAPALLAPTSFNLQGMQWVVAQHLDQTYVGKPNLIAGLPFTPAKPGEIITIFGIGFGPVVPATPPGSITAAQNALTNSPNFRFGQTLAKLQYAGLAPGYVGLYQFNIVVPDVANGDLPLNVDVSGITLAQDLHVTVQN